MKGNTARIFASTLLLGLVATQLYAQVVNTNTTIDLDGSITKDHNYGNLASSLNTTIDDHQTRSGLDSSAWAYAEYSPTELRSRSHFAVDPDGTSGSAASQVSTFDLVTITSPTLAVGTPVTVDFNLFMHGNLTSTFPDSASENNFPDMYGSVSFGQPITFSETHLTGSYLVTLQIDTEVGDKNYLGYTFSTFALVEQGYIGGSITADGWNTAIMYTHSDQDVQVLSSAGFIYRTAAVPEPSCLCALGLGVLVMAGRRKRR